MSEEILERTGSAKDIYLVYENGVVTRVRFLFTDRVSILDLGPLPINFPRLGHYRCAISGFIFQKKNEAGFKTHYLEHDPKSCTMDVMAIDINELGVNYGRYSIGRMLGIEVIDRTEVTLKMLKRIKEGTLNRADVEHVLVGEKLCEGAQLSPAFIECTTKYRDADQYVSDAEAAKLAGISPVELAEVYAEVRRASEFLGNFFRAFGYVRKDGKSECGWPFVFSDSISPDEMRLIGPDGRSYDKDPVRRWFEDNHSDWYQSVLEAKKAYPDDRSKWPKYPKKMPPQVVIDDQVSRYQMVAEAIGAVSAS